MRGASEPSPKKKIEGDLNWDSSKRHDMKRTRHPGGVEGSVFDSSSPLVQVCDVVSPTKGCHRSMCSPRRLHSRQGEGRAGDRGRKCRSPYPVSGAVVRTGEN